jgi:DGQHR domain-containing protein
MSSHRTIDIPALRVEQSRGQFLYAFGIDGKWLGKIAAISRVRRDADSKLSGYQRPEVVSHIADIRRYIESERPMIPNAVVIAFDPRVRFVPSKANGHHDAVSTFGVLQIPLPASADDACKPGWVVDGQQRIAAVRDAAVKSFPMMVVSFIARDDREQREQFILVNSTKPLPKGLIYELLPTTDARLASKLQRRRLPALLLARLNHEARSPLCGMIHTPTTPDGIIKDNSVLRMLENSLSDGALAQIGSTEEPTKADVDEMVAFVSRFWEAVKRTWPEAWALPPRRSRLMHGVGVVSLGFVMDAIGDDAGKNASVDQVSARIGVIKAACHWTSGTWRLGHGTTRKWNELQNTSGDIQLVADCLLRHYREKRDLTHSSLAEPTQRIGVRTRRD